jgi:S1-C subfamily serine protease
MKASCHQCGREYLAARGLAGKPVRCRSCGAMNDGAGGPPPAQPARKRNGTADPIESGPTLNLGSDLQAPPLPDPEIPPPGGRQPNPRGYRRMNMVVRAAAIFLFVVAGVGGLGFWILNQPTSVAGRWEPLQTAVPQISGPAGRGSGFVVEIKDRLWLVTNYHVLDGNETVKVIFRDVRSKEEKFKFDIATEKALVHHEFMSSLESTDPGSDYDLAIFDVDVWRPQIEQMSIEPLRIAESRNLRNGDEVAALGHPGTDFGGTDQKDEDAIGIATHSLVRGCISAVREEAGKPRQVQTDAEIAHGYSGGPLVLEESGEVAAVNTWKDVDENGQSVAGMAFGLAADQLPTIAENGVSLSSVRDRIVDLTRKALPTDLPTNIKWPEQLWAREKWFAGEVRSRIDRGWKVAGRSIMTTDGSGLGHATWKVPGDGPQYVSVLIMPESPLVNLDIKELTCAAGACGADDDDFAGGPTFLPFHDPRSKDWYTFQPGADVEAKISAVFLRKPIEARYVLLWLVAPAEDNNPPVGGSPTGGDSPPPPPPPPGTGTSPQPSPPPPGGWANAVTLRGEVEPKIYASSLIGLREFDRTYLEGSDYDGAIDVLIDKFIPGTWEPIESDRDFFGLIKRVSIIRGVGSLFGNRPSFRLVMSPSVAGASFGVYLEIDQKDGELLSVAGDGLVTSRSDVVAGVGQEGIYSLKNGELVLPISLPWKDAGLRQIVQPTEIDLVLRVKFGDGTSEAVKIRPRIIPHDQVERGYPLEFGVATLVDETHPWIRRIIDEVNQQAMVREAGLMITGGGGGMDDQVISMFLVWRDLMSRGLRYQSMTAAEGDAQRCRTVHEALSTANANCLDGAVLFASFAQAMGIPVDIVLTPDHAFVCAWIKEDGQEETYRAFFIETTKLGDSFPADQKTDEDEYFARLRSEYPLLRCSEFNCFEVAVGEGWDRMNSYVGKARPAVDLVRSMDREYEKRANDADWMSRWQAALDDLSRQVKLLSVAGARRVGVLPVGHPPDLDQKYKFPQRR